MKRKALVILLIFACLFALAGCNQIKNLKDCKIADKLDLSKFQLVFEDNFEKPTVDTSKWNIGDFGNGIRRAGYYTNDSDTLYCEDGNLVMKAIKRDGKYGEGVYTSWLTTSKNAYSNTRTDDYEGFTQTYGYFEVRCIPLKGVGIWSAFWMLPDSGGKEIGGKDGAEIDIMESHYWPQNKLSNTMCHAIHIDEGIDKLQSALSKTYVIDNFYNEFHTFGMQWTPDGYIFSIDGYETWRTNKKVDVSEVDQYLKLTIEVAGTNDGTTPKFGTNDYNNAMDNDWSSADIKFVVDYVRAYSYNG